jgi:hypothetical protein
VPLAVAPSAAEHTSQRPAQAVLQQYPSLHEPEAHTRQPDSLQSPPALALHVAACALRSKHWPFAEQYALLAQPPSVVQLVGQLAWPAHTYGAHAGLAPALPAGRTVHTPSAEAPALCEHTSQPPLHAELQQRPSAQKPLAQLAASVHVCPLTSLHAPAASQRFTPEHVSASAAFTTTVHVPGVTVQVWQVPVHVLLQQTPSAQTSPPPQTRQSATMQSAPAATLQLEPRVFCGWHVCPVPQ